ncbi:CHAP domain-containing protein [Zhihengliuella halotolerans]|uniref:CHAP domain-containing protein n=1 Tax=Zhihengliuella halotolerans TaxID=370736 RepID=UPI0015E0915F|nr:CHAP domain-containing protein [Zhihengliuella halotolerans]
MSKTATLDGNKLRQVKVSGQTLSKQLTAACLSVKLSAASDQVTEMSLTFQDSLSQRLLTGGRLRSGTSVSYGTWSCRIFSVSTGVNSAGPTLTATAVSSGVHKLRGYKGSKSWGTWDVSKWIKMQARTAGLSHIIQPKLGKREIVRVKPEGGKSESTWDVMTALAKELGCWIFEYSNTLVFARPSWLRLRPGRRHLPVIISGWDNLSDGLVEVPRYTVDSTAKNKETLQLELISKDADSVRPGDSVRVTGRAAGPREGHWIVTDVDFPFVRDKPVGVKCVRPVDPEKQPPKPAPKSKKTTGKKTKKGSRSGSRAKASNTSKKVTGSGSASPAALAALRTFSARYNGARLDWDGGYGAQCVDLAKAWNESVVRGPVIRGNGKDWYRNAGRSGAYISIPASGRACTGDLVCWGSSWGSGYGHVGIVVEDRGSDLRTFDQLSGKTGFHTLSKRGLIGYSRPKKWA